MPVATTVDIRDIELAKPGTYAAVSPGRFTVKGEDLAEMVRASQDPEVDKAFLKIGHYDQRFLAQDGDPALGYVTNLRLSKDGTLIGDFTDVPASIAPAITKAYKSRSIEAKLAKGDAHVIQTQSGKKYRAVLTGVALLGVAAPAIAGLKDLESLYAGRDTTDSPVEGDTVLLAFDGITNPDAVAKLHETRSALANNATAKGVSPEVVQLLLESFDDAAELMRESDDASGHDVNAKDRKEDHPVAITEDRLKELLKDEDEKTVSRLVKALASDGGDDDKTKTTEETEKKVEVEPGKTTETETETKTEEAKLPEGMVAISEAVLNDLTAKATAGAEVAKTVADNAIEAEVIAAMRAGKVAPAEKDSIVTLMASKPTETRAMLAARPAVLPVNEIGADTSIPTDVDDPKWKEFEDRVFGFEDADAQGGKA